MHWPSLFFDFESAKMDGAGVDKLLRIGIGGMGQAGGWRFVPNAPKIGAPRKATCHVGGMRMSTPPKMVVIARVVSFACMLASVRSSSTPPKMAVISPP